MVEGDREILTLREASEFLNCHPSTVYRLVKSSQIPAFRLGGSWRFVKPELRRWIKGLTEWPGDGQPTASKPASVSKTAKAPPSSRRHNNRSSPSNGARGRRTGRRS